MITLREATKKDVEYFVTLGKEMHRESAFNFLPFNEKKLRKVAMRNIKDKNSCAFLVFNDAECIGAHIGFLTPYFFCDALLAADIATYVRPQFRGGRAAIMLVKAFINWGKEKKASEVYIGVSAGINLESSDKFFKHLGCNHVGGNYKFRVS